MSVEIEKLQAELNAIYEGLAGIVSRIDKIHESYEQASSIWDPKKITWEQATGPNGQYEKASKQSSKDYDLMIKDLKDHSGRLSRDGLFYWLFQDETIIGRKQSKPRK